VHIFPEAKASVLIFHGNGELVMHYDRIASQYRAMGLQLAAIDYRSYGMSTGKPTLQNSMTDAVIAFKKFFEETGDKPKFILGRSIGGFAASHVEPGRIAGFMIECGMSDSVALINRHHSADHQMQMQSISYISPNANYARGSAPILFIHGSADRLVRPSESEVAFDQIKSPHKHLKIIDGAGHNNLWQFEEYWTAINQVIENQLK